MYKIVTIIQGHIYKRLNLNQGLKELREDQACKNCFASHKDGQYTGKCLKENGGCGCDMGAKSRIMEMKCPLKIWEWDWINLDRLDMINKQNKFNV